MKTALASLFLLVYILPLGVRPLLVPDEARYCEVPREMIRSGDWVVPRLNGLRYFEKPVLGYWAVAVSMLGLGENAFAARLPSAIAAGLAGILIGLIVRRSRLEPAAVALAPSIFLTSVLVYAIGTCNILDSMFTAFLTAALASYYAFHTEIRRPRQNVFLVAVGACCGLAFLVKGFVAFALAGCVIIPFAIWERRLGDLLRRSWIPIVATLVITLPWSVAIHLREPDFWRHIILVQHLSRFAGSMDEQRSNAFWYLPLMLLLGTFPWNMFLLSVSEGVRRIGFSDRLVRFCVCWLIFPFVFFSISRGKLGTYLLPCFPPIAILITIGLLRYLKEGWTRAFTAGVLCIAALPVVCVVLILVRPIARVFGADVFAESESLQRGLALIGFAGFMFMLALALRARMPKYKLLSVCGASAIALALTPIAFPSAQFQEAMPARFLRKHAGRIDRSTIVISDRALVHAICWELRREDVLLLDRRVGELEYGLTYEKPGRIVDVDRFLALTAGEPGQPRVVMILPAAIHATMLGYLNVLTLPRPMPVPRFEATEGGLWIGEFGGANEPAQRTDATQPH